MRLVGAGILLLAVTQITSVIRAIIFDSPKPSMLREYFRRKAQASSGLELRPFAAVQPSMGAGTSVTQLYQFGLQGRF